MRQVWLIALISTGIIASALAQEPCKFGSKEAFESLAKTLSDAKTCKAAAAKMNECAWGSSADTELAPIVVVKCEKAFFDKLSPVGQAHYEEEMQLCAYEYSRQEGTMYMSAAALCQVDVAARFAADPAAANQPEPRASFDCGRAQGTLEEAVCSDISLGRAEIVLSRVFSSLLERANEEDKSAVEQSEKRWLQSVPARCGLSSPPFSAKSLNCVRNEFELRFTELDSCGGPIADCLRDAEVPSSAEMPPPAPRASFDCESPSTALEIVICADANLGRIDIQLAQAYRDAKAMMSGEQLKELAESERNWLQFVSSGCPLGVVGGIPSVFGRSCVRSAFQTRIGQLKACPHKELRQQGPCLNDFRLSDERRHKQQ